MSDLCLKLLNIYNDMGKLTCLKKFVMIQIIRLICTLLKMNVKIICIFY